MRYWTLAVLLLAVLPAFHSREGHDPREEFKANVWVAVATLPPLVWFAATHWSWTTVWLAP